MHSPNKHDFQTAATQARDESIFESELSILRDVFRLLPAGVTVQDERGEFVMMNDAATALLEAAAAAPSASQLSDRRETCLELLRTGRPAVLEEAIAGGPAKQVFLTSHRPIQVAGRNLLISSSTDITEQKAFEDHLFRSAYYDELTGLPTRRVIEHRVNSLLKYDNGQGRFALAFLDIDNFKHINDYYGHPVGDALLVEMAKRLGLDLRDIRHPVADQRRRVRAAAQPDPERRRGRRVHRLHPAAAEGAVLHRPVRDIRLDLDRRQPLSRTRAQLRGAAPERRHRDVPRQERQQGRRGVLRCQHGARGAGADEDRAIAAAGYPGKALLLRLPAQGRYPDPGDQGRRGAGAPARRRGRDSGPQHLHQPCHRTGPDRRTDPSGAGGDRQVDRPDQRDLRPRHHDQHQRRGQAGRQSRIHAAVRTRRSRPPDFQRAS